MAETTAQGKEDLLPERQSTYHRFVGMSVRGSALVAITLILMAIFLL